MVKGAGVSIPTMLNAVPAKMVYLWFLRSILIALAFALAYLMDALIRKSKTRTDAIIYRIAFSSIFAVLILWLVWLAIRH